MCTRREDGGPRCELRGPQFMFQPGINSDQSTHGKRSQQSPSALQHHQHRQGRAALVAPVRYTVLRISHATRTASVNVLVPWHFG